MKSIHALTNQAHCAHVMRLAMDVMRVLSLGLLGDSRFAARADDVLLLAAVYIGQAEGKPMPAAKLAEYAGMARPTAVRKLKELEGAGIVIALDGGRYVLTDGRMDTQEAAQAVATAVRRVASAAAALKL